jgi:hypothetical protein
MNLYKNTLKKCKTFIYFSLGKPSPPIQTCKQNPATIEVLSTIFWWMGSKATPFESILSHFSLFGNTLNDTTNKWSRYIIWLAMTWSLWRKHNNIIFHGEFVNVSSLVEQIKYIDWYWLIGREKTNINVVFSDWCKNPLDCFRWLHTLLLNCKSWILLMLLIIQYLLIKKNLQTKPSMCPNISNACNF